MSKYNSVIKRSYLRGAEKYLLECMTRESFEDSAVYILFIEAVLDNTSKTDLLKKYRSYCNLELDKEYLRSDAIYSELKCFIQSHII